MEQHAYDYYHYPVVVPRLLDDATPSGSDNSTDEALFSTTTIMTTTEDVITGSSSSIIGPENITSLSNRQQIALSLIAIPTSLLSLLCSYLIMTKVYQSTRYDNDHSPYNRILFMFALCDIPSTLNYIIGPFMLPSDTSFKHWAFGNAKTCTISGTLYMFSLSSTWYYFSISIYFLLVIRFSMKQHTIAKYVEPIIHLWSIGFPISLVVVGSVLDNYDEAQLGRVCLWSYAKEVCTSPEEIEVAATIGSPKCVKSIDWGQTADNAWTVTSAIIFLQFFAIILSNLIIYCFVRSTTYKNYHRNNNTRRTRSNTTSFSDRISSWFSNHRQGEGDSFCIRQEQQQQQQSHQQLRRQSLKPSDAQIKRVQQVAMQAFLYVCAFFVTYGGVFALAFLDAEGIVIASEEDSIFIFILFQQHMLPSISIFNFFIYIRPTYTRISLQFPSESRYWKLKRALYGNRIPPTTSKKLSKTYYQSKKSGKLFEKKNKNSDMGVVVGPSDNNATSSKNRFPAKQAKVQQQHLQTQPMEEEKQEDHVVAEEEEEEEDPNSALDIQRCVTIDIPQSLDFYLHNLNHGGVHDGDDPEEDGDEEDDDEVSYNFDSNEVADV